MALAIPPAQAAAIMLPLLCIMDLAGIRAYLGRWDRRVMRIIVPAGLLGCVIGAFTFGALNDSLIRIMLGAIALGFLSWNFLPKKGQASRPGDAAGWFWGTLSGFTSFITHAGGPPIMVYLLPQKLEKAAFVGTSLVFFATLNYAKIVPYVWLGLMDGKVLTTSMALAPVGIAGIYGGLWLQRRIDVRWFYRAIYALLLVTGSKLLYDGVTGL